MSICFSTPWIYVKRNGKVQQDGMQRAHLIANLHGH